MYAGDIVSFYIVDVLLQYRVYVLVPRSSPVPRLSADPTLFLIPRP
jgi:hypothetical protein